jgi:hypothetical protein
LKRVESDLVNVFARLKIIVAGIKMWPLLKMIRNKHGCLRAVLNQGKPGEIGSHRSSAMRPVAAREGRKAAVVLAE